MDNRRMIGRSLGAMALVCGLGIGSASPLHAGTAQAAVLPTDTQYGYSPIQCAQGRGAQGTLTLGANGTYVNGNLRFYYTNADGTTGYLDAGVLLVDNDTTNLFPYVVSYTVAGTTGRTYTGVAFYATVAHNVSFTASCA